MTTAAWRIGVDVGGTFTDLVAVDEQSGERVHLKVSTTPQNPAEAFLEAIAKLHERASLEHGGVAFIFHGTTLATNAIIERRIARTALVTTRGFRDVLEIGRHWRSDLYDMELERPESLVPRTLRLEADERVAAGGTVITPLDGESVERVIGRLGDLEAEAVAVVFLHSYANPVHEQQVVESLRQAFPGRIYVCGSAELGREPREFERTSTTVLNAALMPLVDSYLTQLETSLADNGSSPRLYITHSNGGALSPDAARRRPVGLAQSGPVAGVHACVELGAALGYENLIGFDVGGTSADIALIEGGQARLSTELEIGGLPVRLPSVQVHSIGAGGGSLAWLDEVGALHVGPRSAGATPGPACYGRGGTRPTVTDCHLLLGRLPADQPLAGFLRLDVDAAARALEEHVGEPLGLSSREAAEGVLDVINAEMEGAVRVVLRERGNDPRDFALIAFGGAGALHAVELASRLAIGTVIIPAHPGTFSAQGLLTSDLRQDFAVSRPVRSDEPAAVAQLVAACDELLAVAKDQLGDDPDFAGDVDREYRFDVRYLGQAYEVGVPLAGERLDVAALDRLIADFHDLHERAYAFANREEPCEIRTQRLFVTARVGGRIKPAAVTAPVAVEGTTASVVYRGETLDCEVLDRRALRPDESLPTPCVVVQGDSTTFIPPGVAAKVVRTGNLVITDVPPA